MTESLSDHEQHQLLAYADGRLPGSECLQVEQLLTDNKEARTFIARIRSSALPFADAMAVLAEGSHREVVEQIEKTPLSETNNKNYRGISLAAAALFTGIVVGALVVNLNGYFQRSPTTPGWIAQIANYQQLYVRPTVDIAGPVDFEWLGEMMNSKLGRQVDVPDLAAENIRFRRGQLLQVDGNALVQLAYLPEKGMPVAICIMKNAGKKTTEPVFGQSHGLQYGSWQQDGLGIVVLADLPEKEIQKLTLLARKQLLGS